MNYLDSRCLGHFNGMEVHISTLIPEFEPRETLSEDVQVSEEFREEFNNQLLNFFGRESKVYISDNKTIMHPNVYMKMKKSIDESNYAFC